MAIIALLSLDAGPARAQTSVELVGNSDQSTDAMSDVSMYRAQAFTTGGNSAGYRLTAIEIETTRTPPHAAANQVAIHSSNASNEPDMEVARLLLRTQSPAGIARFTTRGYNLDPNTTYFAVLLPGYTPIDSGYDLTDSDAEDSGGATGWSIGNGSLWKSKGVDAWSTSDASLKMSFHGRGRANLAPTRATVNGSSLTLTFDQALDEDSVPATGAFQVTTFHGGGPGIPACRGWCTFVPSEVSVSGVTVTLTLPRWIPSHGDAWLTYEAPTANPLQSAELGGLVGGLVVTFRDRGVGVVTPNTAPVFKSGYVALGKHMWIDHNEPVTGDSVSGSAFTVTATAEGGAQRTITGTGTVRFFGTSSDGYTSDVKVTLASAVGAAERLTVSYIQPSGNQLLDRDGVPVETYSRKQVTNRTLPQFEPTGATVSESSLTLTFDQALDEDSVPAGNAFYVHASHGGGPDLPRCDWCWIPVTGVAVLGDAVVLTLSDPIPSHARAALGYTPPGVNPLRSAAPGGFVERFSDLKVGVRTPNTEPVFESAHVSGKSLTISHNEAVTGDSVPGSAYTVTATSDGGTERTISGTGTVQVLEGGLGGYGGYGARIRVTLASEVTSGERLRLSYVKPSGNQISDRAGAPVESYSGQPARNGQPRVEGVAIVSNPQGGDGDTYGLGETIRVQVTFDVPVWVDTNGGVPQLKLDLDSGSGGEKPASYESGSDTDTLTFSYTVVEANLSADGIAVPANGLVRNGGRLLASSFYELPQMEADLAHTGLEHDSAHKVDWRISRPTLNSVSVDWTVLTATFNQDLDANSVPAPGAFTVKVAGVRRNVVSGGVALDGAKVRLTLETAVAHGEAVTFAYAEPTAGALRGAAYRHTVASLPSKAVNNITPNPLVWSTSMYTWELGSAGSVGCDGLTGGVPSCLSLVFDRDFEHDGETYRIAMLELTADGDFRFDLDRPWPSYLKNNASLRVNWTTLSFADATFSQAGKRAEWSGTTLAFGDHERVTFDLTRPPGSASGGGSGGSGPTHQSSSVSGNQLTVTFDQALDEGSAPSGGSFKLTATPQGGAGGNGGGFGVGAQAFSRVQATSGDIAGTGTVTVNGANVTVTLAQTPPPGATLTLSYAPPDQSPLRDLEGDEAEEFSGQPVARAAAAPEVTGVAVISDAGADDTYALGETIQVRVTFSEPVAVTGAPRLSIDMDPADWGEKQAVYESGSGTSELVFAYEVVEPNQSTQGIAVLADSLALNGGAIQSTASQMDADLSHAGLGHDPAHKVDSTLAVDPNRAPVIDEQARRYAGFTDSGNAPRGVLVTKDFEGIFSDPDGDELTYTVALSDPAQAALVELLHGLTPEELAEREQPDVVKHLVWFRADTDIDWGALDPALPDQVEIAVTVTAADPQGLTATVQGVFLTHWAPPRVESVAVVSDAGADDTYALGDMIRVQVTFSDAVNVDTSGGTPQLTIDMDPADWGGKQATYQSGSGTSELIFAYEVVEPNYSSQGIAVLANTLALNGGTIRLASPYQPTALGTTDADLSHTGLAHDPRHKVDWQQVSAPPPPTTTTPTVTAVAVSSDAGSDDTYRLGDVIRITVTFSEAVDVSGSPQLEIDMDPAAWGAKWAAYASGSGTATLTFSHTVVQPNFSTQGIAVLANTLQLNGGTIRSAAADVDADLAHSGLGHDIKHRVDWR